MDEQSQLYIKMYYLKDIVYLGVILFVLRPNPDPNSIPFYYEKLV